jgi:anti-sigma factor RsiW
VREEDLELLSAYLDGELSTAQRTRVEARLAAEPELRSALEELQYVVRTLRTVPTLPVPRDFRLDPAKYGRGTAWWARYGAMRLVGTLGAAAAVALIAVGALMGGVRQNAVSSIASAPTALPTSITTSIAGMPSQTPLTAGQANSALAGQTQAAFSAEGAAEMAGDDAASRAENFAEQTNTGVAELAPMAADAAEETASGNIAGGADADQPTDQQAGVMQAQPTNGVQSAAPAAAESAGLATPTTDPLFAATARVVIAPTQTAAPTQAPPQAGTTDRTEVANSGAGIVPVITATSAIPVFPANAPASEPAMGLSQVILIGGIALLVFSGMLLLISFTRPK